MGDELARLVKEKDEQIAQLMDEGRTFSHSHRMVATRY